MKTTTKRIFLSAAIVFCAALILAVIWVSSYIAHQWVPGGSNLEDVWWGFPLFATATMASMMALVAGIASVIALMED